MTQHPLERFLYVDRNTLSTGVSPLALIWRQCISNGNGQSSPYDGTFHIEGEHRPLSRVMLAGHRS